jgi:hypothetical protein
LRAVPPAPDEPDRALDEERRLLELPDPERALGLRAVDPELRELELDLRAVDFRALDPLPLRELDALLREPAPLRELELRPLDPDDLREDPPPDALLRDDDDPLPLPLPLFDSAIAFLLRSFPAAREVRAALSHAEGRGDVRVIREPERATSGARRLEHVETTRK